MAEETRLEDFSRQVAKQLRPDGIDVELLTHDAEKPGLLSCRRPDAGRTVFLLTDANDYSTAKAIHMADYVRQEILPL